MAEEFGIAEFKDNETGETIQVRIPKGVTPNSPQFRELQAQMLQEGLVFQPQTFSAPKTSGPTIEDVQREIMQPVIAAAQGVAGTIGRSIAEAAVYPITPFVDTRLPRVAGDIGEYLGQAIVPTSKEELAKAALLTASQFILPGIGQGAAAAQLMTSIARVMAPVAVDVMVDVAGQQGQTIDPQQLGLMLVSEGGLQLLSRLAPLKFGARKLAKIEKQMGDELAKDISNAIPDMKMGHTTSDLFNHFASDRWDNTLAHRSLREAYKHFDEDLYMTHAAKALETIRGSREADPLRVSRMFGKVPERLSEAERIALGRATPVDLHRYPHIQAALKELREKAPGYTPGTPIRTDTATLPEISEAVTAMGNVAHAAQAAKDKVGLTPQAFGWIRASQGAEAEYRQLISDINPALLDRLDDLNLQYKRARVLFDKFSAAKNPDMFHRNVQTARINLQEAIKLDTVNNALREIDLEALARNVRAGAPAGGGPTVTNLFGRISGPTPGAGGYIGFQPRLTVTRLPGGPAQIPIGPIEAGLLTLLR